MGKEKIDDGHISLQKFPESVRKHVGLFLGSNLKDGAETALREIIDNASDEVGSGHGDTVHVSNDFNGFCYVADNSDRGIPIRISVDDPSKTEALLAITELHSSSKFTVGEIGRVGTHGVGGACTQACSTQFYMLVRVGEHNYKGSIPEVEEAWKSVGPRQKNELYYIIACEKGYKVFEGCMLLKDIEKHMFKGIKKFTPIPRGMTTLIFFKLDPEVFEEGLKPEIPYINLNYFLLIQQRFFGRKKIKVIVDGEDLKCNFKPFKFEIATTIKPKDVNSPNKEVGVYLTFEVNEDLSKADKDIFASVNGLNCPAGFHVNLAKSIFKAALRSQYKVTHDLALEGLKFGIIVLSNSNIYNSQTKENLKSIEKVKLDDFNPVVKEVEKVFRKNSDYWDLHVKKLNELWDSRRNIGAIEKAERMMSAASGTGFYKNRSNLIEGFSDATLKDRWQCEIFLVEGLSPGGSLKSGRRTENGGLKVAVCPMRGKVLNVSDVDINRALQNKEISTLFQVLGVGIQEKNVTTGAKSYEEAHEKLMKYSRYGKICIAVDSDIDGTQIRTLLLYVFSKYARFLIDHGLVYICESPLFEQDGKFFYPGDPVDSNGIPLGINQNRPHRRWKGLGSIPQSMIYDIFYNPATRRLIQVTPEGIDTSMALTENIDVRKKLLTDAGILTNPFNV
jgi:DNA gyrase/topoisomerase IV subunit B